MKRIATVLLLCLAVFAAKAQEIEFAADRPGASTGPAVVGKKYNTVGTRCSVRW